MYFVVFSFLFVPWDVFGSLQSCKRGAKKTGEDFATSSRTPVAYSAPRALRQMSVRYLWLPHGSETRPRRLFPLCTLAAFQLSTGPVPGTATHMHIPPPSPPTHTPATSTTNTNTQAHSSHPPTHNMNVCRCRTLVFPVAVAALLSSWSSSWLHWAGTRRQLQLQPVPMFQYTPAVVGTSSPVSLRLQTALSSGTLSISVAS